MKIVEVKEITEEIVSAFGRLMPQLSTTAPAPSRAVRVEIVASESTVLFLARDPGQDHWIAGALTLALFRIPTGYRAWIEDVVVDRTARRRGIGAALVEAALQHARQAGAITVDLTSSPRRKAANLLYRGLGFEQRLTNVYRYRLEHRTDDAHDDPG
jgi:GNAT superfamily N-acetyltransferase